MSTRRRRKKRRTVRESAPQRTHALAAERKTSNSEYIGYRSHTAAPVNTDRTKRPIEPATQVPSCGRTFSVMAMPADDRVSEVRYRGGVTDVSGSKAWTAPRSDMDDTPLDGGVAAALPGRPTQRLRLALGLLLTAAIVSSPVWLTSEGMLPLMKRLGAVSAAIDLPGGSAMSGGLLDGHTVEPTTDTTTAPPATTTTTTTTTTAPANTDGLKPVSEQKLSGGTNAGGVYVKNSTGYSPDFSAALKAKADCRIKLNAGVQVLIVHTHTTEGYAEREDGYYDPSYSPRTTDQSKSIVAVGAVLAERLEAAGIRTLHAKEVHDHPKYNGSYDRAKTTIENYLEQNPSIEMVIDVHRDAITRDDATKIKPTSLINGRKAAQVMIITGCDAGGTLYFPDWNSNLIMAMQAQQAAQQSAPGLMRPLSFAPYRYNMHLTPNSLLVEFGTDVNTLDEALYSAELFGDALAKVLLRYKVG